MVVTSVGVVVVMPGSSSIAVVTSDGGGVFVVSSVFTAGLVSSGGIVPQIQTPATINLHKICCRRWFSKEQ